MSRIIVAATVVLLASSSALSADFPIGTFSASRQKDWAIQFKEKGKYSVLRDDKVVVEGEWTAKDGEVMLVDKAGEMAGKGKGKYKWKLTKGVLSFQSVKDPSTGRRLVLTSNKWHLKK